VHVDLHVCVMRSPDDVSALEDLFDRGVARPEEVVAVVGKTEGTGLAGDPVREQADTAVRTLLADRSGIPVEAVADRVPFVLSGGSPGVITPHVALISRRPSSGSATPEPRLVVGLATSSAIGPEDVGRMGQVNAVASAVRAAVADSRADPHDVHVVLVKAPTLTEASILAARGRGGDTITTDTSLGPDGAMCWSNDASALGVALGLGEVEPDRLDQSVIRRDWTVYSDVAMTSAGGEKTHAEVVVLGNAVHGTGPLRIGHRSMRDLLDGDAVFGALAVARGDDEREDGTSDVVYAMAKTILPARPEVRGQPITLHRDPGSFHVAKAMGGHLLASRLDRTAVFVSGGEHNSHQGPPDGNPLAVVVRRE
jgi:cyanuric acid amidohydrolase